MLKVTQGQGLYQMRPQKCSEVGWGCPKRKLFTIILFTVSFLFIRQYISQKPHFNNHIQCKIIVQNMFLQVFIIVKMDISRQIYWQKKYSY